MTSTGGSIGRLAHRGARRGWRPLVLALVLVLHPAATGAALWQWMVEMPGEASPETGAAPNAFLWIPPHCEQVRGVVVGQHNMEEETILEHPVFRAALAELGLAAVWVTPPFDPAFHAPEGSGERFDKLMQRLADASGYEEVGWAPVVPIGHSAAASYPWNFAAWRPARTLAAISVSGQWPFSGYAERPAWGSRAIAGVPGLVAVGEYEWAEARAREGAAQRTREVALPMTMLAEPGAGHFDVSTRKVEYLSLYLAKACRHRLQDDGTLRAIDATREGWLVDRWRRDETPRWPAAPVADYRGDRSQAFWCFDERHARATEAFGAVDRGKQVQLLGYRVEDEIVPQVNGTHQQVTLPFRSADGGPRFRLAGTFLDTVPEGRPERWTAQEAGHAILHADSADRITIDRICGPVRKVDASTFEVCLHRLGLNNRKRSHEVWLQATHPGDETFRRAVQQSLMRVPLENRDGAEQSIEFAAIPDQPLGTACVRLEAESSAGLPVAYFVLSGPAEVEGDHLRLTRTPPRSSFPIKVTVLAWQWGRCEAPMVKTAPVVARTFSIVQEGVVSPPSSPPQ